eukprot:1556223-Pleurochrysis_carterae.AAC.1
MVREAALSLVGVIVAVALARIASAAVVRRTRVFRVERVACEFSFAFCDREFAFILRGELVRGETQRFSSESRQQRYGRRRRCPLPCNADARH